MNAPCKISEKITEQEPFVIRIKNHNPTEIKEKLLKIKNLLNAHTGETIVILEIDGHIRKIDLKVKKSPELEEEIGKILK